MPIIEFDHVTKEYRLGHFASLKETTGNQFRRLAGRPVPERAPFKAIDDVTFSVDPGEVLGIIGHNGAGKSTLLKLLAGITTPTSGRVHVGGRIAPLIEVGAGFVPNLTGRENVYLNGSILGLSRKEIQRKFDEIVDFAEMWEFIDTPVKRYSSGMQVKLAFAVATAIDAEIVIVDEVLAVGDLAFQRKCFDRMEDIIREQNRTVLVVSHNMRQIARMCSRAILLDHGRLSADADSQQIVNLFYAQNNEKIRTNQADRKHSSSENDTIRVLSIKIFDSHRAEITKVYTDQPIAIEISFEAHTTLHSPEIVVGTHTTDFVYVTASSTAASGNIGDIPSGKHTLRYILPKLPLKSGVYGLRMAVFDNNGFCRFSEDNLSLVEVIDNEEAILPPLRLVNIDHEWEIFSSS